MPGESGRKHPILLNLQCKSDLLTGNMWRMKVICEEKKPTPSEMIDLWAWF